MDPKLFHQEVNLQEVMWVEDSKDLPVESSEVVNSEKSNG